jgi:hypothetical protein
MKYYYLVSIHKQRIYGWSIQWTAQPLAAVAASLIGNETFKSDFSCGAAKC